MPGEGVRIVRDLSTAGSVLVLASLPAVQTDGVDANVEFRLVVNGQAHDTHGCSLGCMHLQPGMHAFAAYGCSMEACGCGLGHMHMYMYMHMHMHMHI